MSVTRRTVSLALASTALGLRATGASAIELNVTQFGVGVHGLPYAVAKEKGYYKDVGIDVTGFLSSAGGGTTVRNLLASDLPYGEVALTAAIAAVDQGFELSIVHGGVKTADQLWVTRKDDESIKTLDDLKGKTIGYSGPNGVADILSLMMIERAGLKGQVNRKTVGPVGAGLTALREKAVDVSYTFEPAWSRDKDKYRLFFDSAKMAPRFAQTVAVARGEFARKNPDMIKGLIAARRRAVQFIVGNRDETAAIFARYYKISPEVARSALEHTLSLGEYWSQGEIDYEGMNNVHAGLRMTGSIKSTEIDWSKTVDETFLPDDLKTRR